MYQAVTSSCGARATSRPRSASLASVPPRSPPVSASPELWGGPKAGRHCPCRGWLESHHPDGRDLVAQCCGGRPSTCTWSLGGQHPWPVGWHSPRSPGLQPAQAGLEKPSEAAPKGRLAPPSCISPPSTQGGEDHATGSPPPPRLTPAPKLSQPAKPHRLGRLEGPFRHINPVTKVYSTAQPGRMGVLATRGLRPQEHRPVAAATPWVPQPAATQATA